MFDIVEGDFERNLHGLTPRFTNGNAGHRTMVSGKGPRHNDQNNQGRDKARP
jgi:hypothetical protein